jgi:putative glutathione S-transferase
MTTSDAPAGFPKEQDNGRFVRQASKFRSRIGDELFPAAGGRYHLYVSLACPWAHRTVITRLLLGLEDAISMSLVDPIRDDRGWRFGDDFPDPLHDWQYLSQAYFATDEHFGGRVSVPVLWDKQTNRIVNNESADIIVDLVTQFGAFATKTPDLYPESLRSEIDTLNHHVYTTLNDGVYQSGFATTQHAYERAVLPLFDTLDELEQRLAQGGPFLFGDQLTLADIRLFTTLVRFDAVYHGHFKCNVRRIVDYPSLQAFLKRVYRLDGIAETVDFDQIKRHYYVTHRSINPTGIVPVGPALDL